MSYNPRVKAGATLPLDITLKENRVAIDLTGASAKMQLRDNLLDETFAAELIGVIAVPASGQIQFTLTPEQTLALLPDGETSITFVYDVMVTFADGVTEPYLNGQIKIYLGVTRD